MQSFQFNPANMLANLNSRLELVTKLEQLYSFQACLIIQPQYSAKSYRMNESIPKDIFNVFEKFSSKEVTLSHKQNTMQGTQFDCYYRRLVPENVNIFVSGKPLSAEEMQELSHGQYFYLCSRNPIENIVSKPGYEIIKTKIVRFNLSAIIAFMQSANSTDKINWNAIRTTKIAFRFRSMSPEKLLQLQSDKYSMLLSEIIDKYQNEQIKVIVDVDHE